MAQSAVSKWRRVQRATVCPPGYVIDEGQRPPPLPCASQYLLCISQPTRYAALDADLRMHAIYRLCWLAMLLSVGTESKAIVHKETQCPSCRDPTNSSLGQIAPRRILQYTTHWGLCNQLQMHKTAFMMAYTLGAELVLAPARKRAGFDSFYLSDPFEKTPIGTLLDARRINAHWSKRGMLVHEVCHRLMTHKSSFAGWLED